MRFGGVAHNIEHVELIGSLGLDFAEVKLSTEKDLINQPDELLRVAKKWDLTYLVHAPLEKDPFNLYYLEKEFLKEITRLLFVCRELSAPIFTVHFWMDRRFVPKKTYAGKQEILERMARKASEMDIKLCLETLTEPVEDIYPLLAECPELDLTLDIGHVQLLSEKNRSLDYLERCPERIRHIHAHDNRGGRYKEEDFKISIGKETKDFFSLLSDLKKVLDEDLHLPIGEGIIDFLSIFRALKKVGYQETVTVEVPHEYLESSVQKLRKIVESIID
jgi:sugar phosphate isomerase/epimerase